ncbi:hypothetical protein MAP00_001120 [Monascus purpureus]|nr:hypothetical protein MAP00_001120 [Monascus purpureus]
MAVARLYQSPQLDTLQPRALYATTNPAQGQGIIVSGLHRPLVARASFLRGGAAGHAARRNVGDYQRPEPVAFGRKRVARHDAGSAEGRLLECVFASGDALPEIPTAYRDCEHIVKAFQTPWTTPGPQCAVHGDPHSSNTFMTPQRQIGVLDHQNVHISSPLHDLSCVSLLEPWN